MKFSAADGSRGCGQAAHRSADSHGEKVCDQNRHEHHDADERKCLAVQVRKARVVARFAQAALSHNGPVQFAERAIRADHFHRLFSVGRIAHRFRIVQILRQSLDSFDHFVGTYVFTGNKSSRVRVRDQFSAMVYDEYRSSAHARVFQSLQNRPERNHCREHSGELVVFHQRNRDYKRGLVVWHQG